MKLSVQEKIMSMMKKMGYDKLRVGPRRLGGDPGAEPSTGK